MEHNILIDKIKRSNSLPEDALTYLSSIGKVIKIKKGENLIIPGKPISKSYFVTEGCMRAYCMNKDAKEHTLQFAIKEWWISDFIALYNHEPSSLTVESITDATLIEFDFKDLEKGFKLFPEFESFQRKNLERHVVSVHKRILNQLQLSAAERYELFLKEYPDIEKMISNYHIASYLGITQQSLSRIRVENSKK
ncbi:Crp/Fnr family transcriptional regulator [Flammeovirga agarivorans]|uniref:Crp/Fnr family transcriptional regulator n=1 Tax=Flammeovirga agarivorans TaxID=2726742 RepID=A0A7X8SKU2_9BACT|nr:Crp/Fnr family transcriptional regulator [Flammeovirga agarivorans]NLR91977.1 Crp/Fnr family transcriptional regulator [Flammeovirga agarivorans]